MSSLFRLDQEPGDLKGLGSPSQHTPVTKADEAGLPVSIGLCDLKKMPAPKETQRWLLSDLHYAISQP